MFAHDIIKKRILVFGVNGMLGQRVTNHFVNMENVEFLGVSMEDASFIPGIDYLKVDISQRQEVKRAVLDFYPDFIVNAAAFTNVDLCESQRETAWKVNVKGVEFMCEGARITDAHLIHFSTDYVFNGKSGPYSENDKPDPVGYYGRTKLASENAIRLTAPSYTVFRINVLYGVAHYGRPDFVRWVVSSLRENKTIRIVKDQINNPTFIDDAVQGISKAIEFRKTGIYNIGGREFLSRLDFTYRIAGYFDLDKTLITVINTSELNQAARRPLNSGLYTIKAETELGFIPTDIEESFRMMKDELGL